MNKAELVSYLADLLSIDAYLDDLGVAKSWLNREEHERMIDLEKIVTEEQKKADEARKSE